MSPCVLYLAIHNESIMLICGIMLIQCTSRALYTMMQVVLVVLVGGSASNALWHQLSSFSWRMLVWVTISQKKHYISITKIYMLMLFWSVIADYSENHNKSINTYVGKMQIFLTLKQVVHVITGSWDNVVGIATGYRLDDGSDFESR
jgi:hypothetical protein